MPRDKKATTPQAFAAGVKELELAANGEAEGN